MDSWSGTKMATGGSQTQSSFKMKSKSHLVAYTAAQEMLLQSNLMANNQIQLGQTQQPNRDTPSTNHKSHLTLKLSSSTILPTDNHQ